ncbi:MAG: hypothetical protein HOP08_11135 [Cyclobacteriaceae bacterium]|nr:hypothetical protein [Cyclobacteriaceae bacterium]
MNFFRAISNLLRFDRTNWKALALCLFAAAIFWIFNALNKNYATNLKFPLHFEYDASKYIAVDPLPSSLALNVSGNGWDLLRKSLGVKVPTISMTLERPTEARKIVAGTLSPIVASQIGSLHVNYIVTDTLRLKIEPAAKRKIILKADLSEISYKKNFGRSGPVVILPDSVMLEGPKSLIEKLSDTIILKIQSTRVDGNVRENAEVIVSHKDLISRNPPVAEVMFEVGPVVEVMRYLKLKTPKIPWGTELVNDSVAVSFIVPQKNQKDFLNEPLLAELSDKISEIQKGETKSFLPIIRKIPEYAVLTHIDSIKVKKY